MLVIFLSISIKTELLLLLYNRLGVLGYIALVTIGVQWLDIMISHLILCQSSETQDVLFVNMIL